MTQRDRLYARLSDLQRDAMTLDEQIKTFGAKRLMVEGAIRELTEALAEWPDELTADPGVIGGISG